MYVKINAVEETSEGKALVIKNYPTLASEEPVTIGIIFPAEYAE